MENSQLVLILRTLSKKEQRELRKWLLSPAHNQREDVVRLYDYLCSGNHLTEEKFLRKEWLFRRLFPGEEYDDARLRQTVHFLQRATEEFLAWQRFCCDEVQRHLHLASEYQQRKLEPVFHKTIKRLDKLQADCRSRDETFYRSEFRIQQQIYNYLTAGARTTQLNLQEIASALDLSYAIEKLKLCCHMLFHQRLYKTSYDIALLEEVVRHIEQRQLMQEPVIAVYYYIFKALSDEGEGDEYFVQLRATIRNHREALPRAELREVYLMALNLIIRRMNRGEERFVKEGFEWYREGLDSRLLIEQQQISQMTFLNIVLNALKLKRFSYAEQFIREYESYLGAVHRESFTNFSRAKLRFDQGRLSEAMTYLLRTEHSNILINLSAKAMLLKIYYELEETDALESLLESFRTYLNRKEVIGYHRQIYSNLVRFTRRLVRINPYDESQRQRLRSEIEADAQLSDREWLLERLDRMEA